VCTSSTDRAGHRFFLEDLPCLLRLLFDFIELPVGESGADAGGVEEAPAVGIGPTSLEGSTADAGSTVAPSAADGVAAITASGSAEDLTGGATAAASGATVEPPSTAAVAFGASRGGDASFAAGVTSRDELVDDDVELTGAPISPGDGSPALGPGFCSTVLAAATTVFGSAGSPAAVGPAITLPAAPATTAAPI
jgi:hypothetical protein